MQHTRRFIPPCPRLAGYWQTWNLPGGETLPIECVPCTYGDVIIAFVAPDADGVLRFAGPNVPTRREVYRLQQRGQRVLLSVGGGGVSVALDSARSIRNFGESLCRIARELGVNGIDIDVEEGIPAQGRPDRPTGTTLGLIRGIECALNSMPPGFMLTMAPETANLVGGISRFGGAWGNYLPLLLYFGDRVTRVHMQYYNSGTMAGLDGAIYHPGTDDFAVAMTEAILRGFPIANTGVCFCGLPSWKVAIGLPATPSAAGNGYMPEGEIAAALSRLPMLAGLMTWSVQWDARNCFAFANAAQRLLFPRNRGIMSTSPNT